MKQRIGEGKDLPTGVNSILVLLMPHSPSHKLFLKGLMLRWLLTQAPADLLGVGSQLSH